MGQPLPLPKRIPRPTGKVLTAMNECGITIDIQSEDEYVTYSLPSGWRMVNDSHREDLPEYHIVDDKNMVRCSITGAWKGTYDNKLHLSWTKEPYEFEARHGKMIPSETNGAALVGKFAEALDPLNRPLPDSM